MAQRYWDPELEAMPWDEVLAWQAARAAPFVRALTARSEFHRALLGTGPAVDAAAGLEFLAGLLFTTKDDMRRSQAEGRPASRSACAPGRATARGGPDPVLLRHYR